VVAAGVAVRTYDLAQIVDAECTGAVAAGAGQGIVEGGVGAIAIEKAVVAAGVLVEPDDLAHRVDAECVGAVGGQRVVEGGEDIDWHGAASSDHRLLRGERDLCGPARLLTAASPIGALDIPCVAYGLSAGWAISSARSPTRTQSRASEPASARLSVRR